MKDRKPYEKPAVIFEKNLEALAGACDEPGDRMWDSAPPTEWYCKAAGFCTTTIES